MNLIDLLLILVIVFSAFSGWHKGFILASMDLITWVGSLIGSFLFYPYLSILIVKIIPSLGVWIDPIAFFIALLIIHFLFGLLFNAMLTVTPVWAHGSFINKFLGIVPGFISGLITATIIALLLMAMPLWDGLSNQTKNSVIAGRLALPAEWLEEKLSPVFNEAIKKTIARLTIEPGSKETVKLPFTTTHVTVRENLEQRMLQMVNEERANAGLKPLQYDPELTEVARAHSRDMFARGYFSHYTPEGEDPFERMKKANIHFLSAGENLAMAQTLGIAHSGLMHSPGHRANILSPAFGRVGIGIIDGGIYGLMISQEFRN